MSTVVIGGGITGLSAAWRLARAREPVTVVEPGPLGGLLRTERIGECVVECGADSWIRTKPWLRDLVSELGLAADVVPAREQNRGTWVFRGGRLLPLPRGLRFVAPAEWRPVLRSPLLGWRTKTRMLRELFRAPSNAGDRSVADFVRDHFGDEAVEYLAEPLFAGVYGGTPETLGAAAVLPVLFDYEQRFGSLIRGARGEKSTPIASFESMRGGLGQIIDALVAQLGNRVRFVSARAEALAPGRVRVDGEWLSASHVLLACGAPAAADLLANTAAGEQLARIRHTSATIVAFGFRRDAFAQLPRGFGFLVPRRERQTILAATWVTNKFEHRAPEHQVVVRCFVSGDHGESVIPDVLRDLHRITGFTAAPWFERIYRWPNSMPQYAIGHANLIVGIMSSMPPDISLAGAFLNGVGMPDCVRSGTAAADQLLERAARTTAP